MTSGLATETAGGLSGNSSFTVSWEERVSGECSPVQNIMLGAAQTSGLNTIFALSKFLHTLKAMISLSPGICSINTKKETVLWMERVIKG